MPRIQLVEGEPRSMSGDLVSRLAEELKSHRTTGQPMVREQEFRTGKIQTTVIWDDWNGMSLEDRTAVILSAYAVAEEPEYRERIALASGLTVPEAEATGMLPYQVITALRKGDPVTLDQCRDAMISVGASKLRDPRKPELRFATSAEAKATLKELIRLLPESEQVWMVIQNAGTEADLSGELD